MNTLNTLKTSNPIINSVNLNIAGMNCASCVVRVERALQAVPGVNKASVNLASEQATVTYNDKIAAADLKAAITSAGYRLITPEMVELDIEGMSCASCVGRIERALLKLDGVAEARVNLASARASVQLNFATDPKILIDTIEKAGYHAQLSMSATSNENTAAQRQEKETLILKRELGIATILTLPVFIAEMGSHLIPAVHYWINANLGMQNSWYIQFVLTSLVLLFPGLRFYRHGLPALWRRAPDMNSLVAVGTLAAYSFSVLATFAADLLPAASVAVYYEAAAVIVNLILLGRYLEAKAKGRTSQAIQRLVGLQAKTARVKRDGNWQDIEINRVLAGDIVSIRPGERIPVDGEVVDGLSFVDESMISGEPIAVEKKQDDQVIAGTVNQKGALEVRVTAVGSATVLAQIINLVEQAQGSKLAIQTLVDKITLWFVPAVILLAGLTFIGWYFFGPEPALSFALVNAVAVLIIACPCAMGLATPTSIMVASGRAAEMGILFRQGEALQLLKQSQLVAFDKTGTLTAGKPVLNDFILAEGFIRDEVLIKIASVEAKSEHPIAQAIVEAAGEQGLSLEPLESFESHTGLGVSAMVAGQLVEIGADRYMRKLGLSLDIFSKQTEALANDSKTPIFVAIDGKLAAIIAVADPIKESSYAAIEQLHALGLKVVMISGDNRKTAEAIAGKLGIDEVIAEVLPAGKVQTIKRLQQQYGCVAYVGDGINDAPALAQADIGIAIGSGTDIAIEAADVVLMSGNLQGVVNAIALSKATMRNIHQNLFWAFAYNAALIPVAAGLLYSINGLLLSPIFAAGAMALSSVFVLSNALRLKRFSAPFNESVTSN